LLLKQNGVVPYERTYDCPECPKTHDIGDHKDPVSVPNGNFQDLHVQQTVDKWMLEDKRISEADIQRQLVEEIAHSQYFVSKIRFIQEDDHINMARVFRATITVANPDELKKKNPNYASGIAGDFLALDRGESTYKQSRNIPSYSEQMSKEMAKEMAMPMSQEDFDAGIEKLKNYSIYSKYMRNGT